MKKVQNSIFAEDKLSYTSSYKISAITSRLQKIFDRNRRYFHKWKIKLNDSKTEAVLFTKRRLNVNSHIKVNGHPLAWLDEVKYLGITLDSKLTFTSHVKKKFRKCHW